MKQKLTLSIINLFLLIGITNVAHAQNNVGVGTNTPSEKLDVIGNVKADTVKANVLKVSPNASLGKILTSDADGNASWQASQGLPIGVNTGNIAMWDATGNNWVAKTIATANSGGSQPFSNMQPYLAVNFCIIMQGIFPSFGGSGSGDNYLANIQMFAGNFAPGGTLLCNGQLMSIAQNSAVFSLLGTAYGGNGQTTFGLPDFRGRVPIHNGQGPGLTNYSLGEVGGSENTTLTLSEMPIHNHSVLFTAP